MKPIWTPFKVGMPSARDGDARGYIELLERNGATREGMWDWVPTAEHWNANGFTAWRRIIDQTATKA